MTLLKSEIIRLWEKSAKTIHERFGLQSPLKPREIVVVDDNAVLRWGGHYDTEFQRFFISKEINRTKVPLAGIVFRENMMVALPVALCIESRRDIGEEYAHQFLQKRDKQHWID